jgi:hypothetical protein
MGTFVTVSEPVHCGDGAVDGFRILGRNDRGDDPVNAHSSLDGLASSLTNRFVPC